MSAGKRESNPRSIQIFWDDLTSRKMADNMYQRSELDYLIYNDPIGYADLILNGDPETYLKTVTEYRSLDS